MISNRIINEREVLDVKKGTSSYPLRLRESVKEQVANEASTNRRSRNAEIELLIEDGFKWREQQNRQTA